MGFLNITDDEYIYQANRPAFKLLAESDPFHSKMRILTVYDHENEVVREMMESSLKRGIGLLPASPG